MALTVAPANIRPLKGCVPRARKLSVLMVAGMAGYIMNDGKIGKADKDNVLTAHARGLVIADGAGSTEFAANREAAFVYSGPVGGFSGMTPGGIVYVGDDGALTQTKPVAGFVSVLGFAEDENILIVQPSVLAPVAAA